MFNDIELAGVVRVIDSLFEVILNLRPKFCSFLFVANIRYRLCFIKRLPQHDLMPMEIVWINRTQNLDHRGHDAHRERTRSAGGIEDLCLEERGQDVLGVFLDGWHVGEFRHALDERVNLGGDDLGAGALQTGLQRDLHHVVHDLAGRVE